jgi:hypothetical protein
MPPTSGAKECQAAEPHGLPRPVLGTNGEVTAVSANQEAAKNAYRRSIPILTDDTPPPGPSRLPLRAGLTARP